MFNKPYKVLSQFKELDDKLTLKSFINLKEKPRAVGRLDFDSEGLLLLTDDIKFSTFLTDPKSKIEKEYHVQVEGIVNSEQLILFKKGIVTQTEVYMPAFAEIIEKPNYLWERDPPIRTRKNIPTSWLRIIIREGKNRQIRKMTAFIGNPTLRLIRYRIGKLELNNLKPGRYLKCNRENIC